MLQYLAFAWNPRNPRAAAALNTLRQRHIAHANTYRFVFHQPGIDVYCAAGAGEHGAAIPLHHNSGMVLGTLFEVRDPAPDIAMRPLSVLDEAASQNLLSTEGRAITSRFWGSYVLILHHVPRARTYIVRGPMSRLPCFCASYDGVDIFFSDVEYVAQVVPLKLSVNWDCVRAQVAHGDYLTHETALSEVSALQCGECLDIGPDGTRRRVYWEPRSVLNEPPVLDFRDASHALKVTTQYCVSAWVSSHRTVLHTLSGGLDSSIVLSCLVNAPTKPHVRCVNYYSDESGDERVYATAMARHVGIEIIEQERNRSIDMRVFLNTVKTANPMLHFTGCDFEPTNAAFASQIAATAIFDGELGDDVFGHSLRHDAVGECIQRYGISRRFFKAAIDLAMLRRESIWRTLLRTYRVHRRLTEVRYWSQYRNLIRESNFLPARSWLVSEEALWEYERSLTRFIHPWFRDVAGIPYGTLKLMFSSMVATSTAYQSPFAKPHYPPTLSPLASQPLIELALRIPSHLHIEGGTDRAVARAAFADDLAPLVLNRGLGKGTPDLWLKQLVARNREFLREFLFDGMLVNQGLLDRRKVDKALAADVSGSGVFISDVLVQSYIEAWLRGWSSTRYHTAA
jgi:asparagine synthase (glutamine-hydrolysing)